MAITSSRVVRPQLFRFVDIPLPPPPRKWTLGPPAVLPLIAATQTRLMPAVPVLKPGHKQRPRLARWTLPAHPLDFIHPCPADMQAIHHCHHSFTCIVRTCARDTWRVRSWIPPLSSQRSLLASRSSTPNSSAPISPWGLSTETPRSRRVPSFPPPFRTHAQAHQHRNHAKQYPLHHASPFLISNTRHSTSANRTAATVPIDTLR